MLEIRPGVPVVVEPVVDGLNLDIGSGEAPIPGFTHLDGRCLSGIDIVCDLTLPLPYGDCCVDIVYSSHFLEHLEPFVVPGVLADWCRVLKSGGAVEIHVPNLMAVAEHMVSAIEPTDVDGMLPHIFGGFRHPTDCHKTGFTFGLLAYRLQEAGFSKICEEQNRIDSYDLSVVATK